VRNSANIELGALEQFQRNNIDVDGNRGWYRTFARSNESNFVPTTLLRTALLINTYTPGISDCEPLGKSYLYALNAFNGLAAASLGNLVRSPTDVIGDYEKVEEIYDTVDGVAMNVTLTGNESGIIPTSPGELKKQKYSPQATPGVRRSWMEIPLDMVH
jgi:Tfp pilus tip-associated adhesin PilY1